MLGLIYGMIYVRQKGAKRREIKMTSKAITSESTIKAFRFKAAALNFINTHFPEDDSITIIYRDGFYEVVVYETVFCIAE
jgi:hypothetical protein